MYRIKSFIGLIFNLSFHFFSLDLKCIILASLSHIVSWLFLQAKWITDTRPAETWPQEGRLQFENYKVRYRPGLDLVLHGISCDIQSTEKVSMCVSVLVSVHV